MDSKYSLNEHQGKGATLFGFNSFSIAKRLDANKKKKLLKKKLTQNKPILDLVVKSAAKTSKTGQNGHSPALSVAEQKKLLPVYKVKDKLMVEIRRNNCLILLGETGSGKTTQIPQFIFENGQALLKGGKCAITQPRRMAAISIAQRVALEQNSRLGEAVGYVVRFEDVTSPRTKIQYMTDGSLLRQALNDRLLMAYNVIILDEAHERTINTDVLFGLTKAAQKERQKKGLAPLKIIVMSATMDVDHFANYFNRCQIIYLEGRLFPVTVYHVTKNHMDYLDTCLNTLFNIHTNADPSEDVLIFLTGQEEIDSLVETINEAIKLDHFKDRPLRVFPLYAQLPQHKQLEVFKPLPEGVRKVILATNIAETSITIRGIKYVIDSGVVKQKTFNPGTRIESLKVSKISQAQAWQRTGRAGRESEGFCYRTYTVDEYQKMPRSNVPEIVRSNLSTTVLQLLALGIDCRTFDFMDKPSDDLIANSFQLLVDLKAVDSIESRKLTDSGWKMAKFPLDPRYSRILLASEEYGCLEEALSVVALLSGENVFLSSSQERREQAALAHRKFESKLGDHVTLLNAFNAFRAAENPKSFCFNNYLNVRNMSYASEVRKQLEAICQSCNLGQKHKNGNGNAPPSLSSSSSEDTDFENLRRCLLVGFSDNVARLQKDNFYLTVPGRQRAKLHPSSILSGKERPELVFFTEFVSTGQNYLKKNTVIDPEWLQGAFNSTKVGRNNFQEMSK